MTILSLLFPLSTFAQSKILNVYAWGGEIPDFILRQFEKESGIKVNFSTYENNEVMFAKLRTSKNVGYDIVMPSGYFVSRMVKQDMLQPLDKSKLPNWKNLNPDFLHVSYDPDARYAAPYIWGVTGIFVNNNDYSPSTISKWNDLWAPRFTNEVMLIDDMREVFGMALISLGYSPNETNPEHIKAAFVKLKDLMKNVKVFSSDTLISIMIDEDATVGMAWNGDVYKASSENAHLKFIVPAEGAVKWMDNFAIPKDAPHADAAHTFLNFIMRADVARDIALYSHYPTANKAGWKLLPDNVKNNPIAYPPGDVLRRAQFQADLPPETLAIYEKYWDELKMGG
jgi:spermidine/putrescine transport system substrate-binding protein